MAKENLEKAKQIIGNLISDLSKSKDEETVKRMISDALNEVQKGTPGERKGRFDEKDAHEMIKSHSLDQRWEAVQKVIDTSTEDESIKSLQRANDDVYLVSQMLDRPPQSLKIYKRLLDHPLLKADSFGGAGPTMPTPTTHYGADFIPLGFSADLIDRVRLALKVAALHRRIEMPTPQYKLPVHGGTDITAYLVGETITSNSPEGRPTASRPTSMGVTLDAKKIGALVYFSEEITEDSIVPVLPFLKDSMSRAMGNAQETAAINGQKSGTIDTGDVPGSTDVRKAWDGYRYCCSANAKVNLASWTGGGTYAQGAGLLRSMRSKMGRYGTDPKDLAWVTSIAGYHQMLGVGEVLKLNEYGPDATILKGELGKFDNIPIIVSEFVRQDLDTTGVYSGTTTNKTIIMLVHTPSWVFGDRRAITVKVKDIPEDDNHLMVCHQRLDFVPLYNTSTEYVVSIGYNLAVL